MDIGSTIDLTELSPRRSPDHMICYAQRKNRASAQHVAAAA
jgi:hypothetical protein